MPTTMLPALRILQIEDSVDDAELTCIELRDAGLHVHCLRIDDEAGLRHALREFRPQLVLSDFNLPGFSADHALQITRAQAPAARFIVFSGEPGSDEPGLRGSDGWLCKTDAAQLPALIRRLIAGEASVPA